MTDNVAVEAPARNRLGEESSPYLRQHAGNPVGWFPWGGEAFQRALRENKPVFLSVGYASCHWCHVMAHESFEDEEIGRLLNEHFISVKVDREERPDVDDVYMTATHLVTGRGGWPNSVWLTPDGRPWFAGTYFPKNDSEGRAGFGSLLRGLARAWKEKRAAVEKQADILTSALRSQGPEWQPGTDFKDDLAEALSELRRRADLANGGFGRAPKFPPHMELRLLLREGKQTVNRNSLLSITLEAMARGGIRDAVGGGFHRYATDDRWRVPHFEKMLFDNALLAALYLDAGKKANRADWMRVAGETCDWMLRELSLPGGGFASALDADSEGKEGAFYLWPSDQVRASAGSDADRLCRLFGIREDGNVRDERTGRRTGLNVLARAVSLEEAGFASEAEVRAVLDRLLEARARRPRPLRDDKLLAAPNGLVLGTLARCGRALQRPDWETAARTAAEAIWSRLWDGSRLAHHLTGNRVGGLGFLDDYAAVADGFLDLAEGPSGSVWQHRAEELAAQMIERFRDESARGFYFTDGNAAPLLVRPRMPYDQAGPSPAALALRVFRRLAVLTHAPLYRVMAGECYEAVSGAVARIPAAACGLLTERLEFSGDL